MIAQRSSVGEVIELVSKCADSGLMLFAGNKTIGRRAEQSARNRCNTEQSELLNCPAALENVYCDLVSIYAVGRTRTVPVEKAL